MFYIKVLISVFFMSFFSCTYAEDKQKIIRLTTSEFPPYISDSLEGKGFLVKMIRGAFQQQGYQVEIDFYPWQRAFILAKKGGYDGIFPLWYSDERAKTFLYSRPTVSSEITLYKQKQTIIKPLNYNTIKNYSIGAVRGYANPPLLNQSEILLELVTYDIQNLQKLAKGRVDLIVMDNYVANYLLMTELPQYVGKLTAIYPPLEKKPHYLGLNHNSSHLKQKMTDFNRGFTILEETGQIKTLLAPYQPNTKK